MKECLSEEQGCCIGSHLVRLLSSPEPLPKLLHSLLTVTFCLLGSALVRVTVISDVLGKCLSQLLALPY